jgi:DNA-binding PadR family transcriptional regulator
LLVLLAEGPKHGYQLKLDFEAATGEAWPLNIGQVYTTLQRLERDELVKAVGEDDEGRIAYRITVTGREEVEQWLGEPVERTVANRDEVSMKLLLTLASGVVDPQQVIDTQRRATMQSLQDYTRLRSDSDRADVPWQLHIDRLILRSEAELRWLDRVEDRMAQTPTRPQENKDETAVAVQEGSK